MSIGIALARPGDADAAELLRRADAALYAAKAGGRRRHVFAQSSDAGPFQVTPP